MLTLREEEEKGEREGGLTSGVYQGEDALVCETDTDEEDLGVGVQSSSGQF